MNLQIKQTKKATLLRNLIIVAIVLAVGVSGWLVATRQTSAYTADAFVMRVKTDNAGTSGANQFTIPAFASGVSPNYNVDCNDDGTIDITGATGAATCTYPSAGTYTVAITGTFPRIAFNNGGDRLKLLEIRQWGTGQWRAFDNAFYGAANMQLTATDTPNLSSVTTMLQMFRGATVFTGAPSMASWNTANVTSFWSMFELASNFNAPIGTWNVSNATTLYGMFANATSFNQPLNSWNVANVTDFRRVFATATSFNQDLNSWNTAKATTFNSMFQQATAFNGQISAWTTTTATDLSYMFSKASAFNRDISGWDVANVVNMTAMFQEALVFNQPIGVWNTAKLKDLNTTFTGARSFNQPIDSWNVSGVTNMQFLFNNAVAFNQPLNSWNTGSVTNMQYLFANASVFNQPLSSWNTASVTVMNNMFANALVFDQPLGSWNTGNVLNMSSMFSNAKAFNQSLNSWNTGKVTTIWSMFSGASVFNGAVGGWDTSKVIDMSSAFASTLAFNQPLDTWNVSNVTTMTNMFSSAKAFNQPLNSWNTGNVTAISGIFHMASNFNGAISNWNTSKVTNMSLMFRQALAFNQPISAWDVSNVTNMASMLEATAFNQSLATWNTQNVTNMGALLYGSSSFNQPLGMWNVQKVTNMSNMLLSTAMSVANYDSTLQGWLSGGVSNNVQLRATARYCVAESARATLIATYGWTINDVGKGCPGPTITITAPTKLQNSPITNTTITVTESYADLTVNAANVIIGTGTTVGRTGYTCTQVTAKSVSCTLTITSSGNLAITATNSGGASTTRTETGYIVDIVKPVLSVAIDSSTGINTPRLTFTATDNIAVARTEVVYYSNNEGPGVGPQTTIPNATSPLNLVLDPDEAVHHVIVRTYDTAGNMTERDLLFPPIVNFNAPTTIKNSTITDATVTITAPSGNPIDNITLAAGTTGATLGTCMGAGNDTTSPYNQPVTCQVRNVSATGTVTVRARDAGNGAIGQNSQSFIIETNAPTISVAAPTKRSNGSITNTVVTVQDDMAINASDVSISLSALTGDLSIEDIVCTQVHTSEVRCTLGIVGANGTADLQVYAADKAGNTSSLTESEYEIDTVAPTVDSVVLSDGSDSGIKGDAITNDTTPSVTLACTEVGTILAVYVDGMFVADIICDVIGDVEVPLAHSGNPLTDGSYEVTYTATDELGNTSGMSPAYTFTVDTVAPIASITRAAGQQATTTSSTAAFIVSFTKPVRAPLSDDLQVMAVQAGRTTGARIQSIVAISATEWRVVVENIAEGESIRLLLSEGIVDTIDNTMDTTDIELIGADAAVTRLVPEDVPGGSGGNDGSSIIPGIPNTGIVSLTTISGALVALVALLGLVIVIARRRRQQI